MSRRVARSTARNGPDVATLVAELVQKVRDAVGPIANFKRALVVTRLPKTRSGKILRQVIRKMIDGDSYSVPSTIDDPDIIRELEASLIDGAFITPKTPAK